MTSTTHYFASLNRKKIDRLKPYKGFTSRTEFNAWESKMIVAVDAQVRAETASISTELENARKVIKETKDAWELLPEGNYRPSVAERWLVENMAPAIQAHRDFLISVPEGYQTGPENEDASPTADPQTGIDCTAERVAPALGGEVGDR